MLLEKDQISVKVINLPWLNEIDSDWLMAEISGYKWVFSLDNHYLKGGQGDAIARVMAGVGVLESRLINLGVDDVPPSGTNPQVLKHVGLNVNALVNSIRSVLSTVNKAGLPI
jgi:transketolase